MDFFYSHLVKASFQKYDDTVVREYFKKWVAEEEKDTVVERDVASFIM